MRIGLFGGSFDPPHVGHLLAASDAYEALGFDRLVWIPAARQPLKVGVQGAGASQRLDMVRAAVAGDRRFEVSPIEIERSGLSFTVETVEALARQHPHGSLVVLVGADVLPTFGRWRAPRRIAELAQLAVLHRTVDGAPAEKAAIVGAVRAVIGTDMPAPLVLETRRVDVSSTEIRERARTGRSLHGFVPDMVARYIGEHGLYR